MGVIKGDTRGLDYSSNSQLPLLMQPPPPNVPNMMSLHYRNCQGKGVQGLGL